MRLRTLIVDDEPLARQGLREFLEGERDVDVVGECGDGLTALTAIRERSPDLVLLDVQMPELTGFGVLERLDRPLPAIIFVTAHDKYALDAFDAHAIDYLLKPVDRSRFRLALNRARAQIAYDRGTAVADRLDAMLEKLSGRRRHAERLAVKSRGAVSFVRVEEIDWIEAAGNYVRLHAGPQRHLLRQTMAAVEQQLDPERFVRIHRSAIVNVDRIREIQPWFKGDHLVILVNGKQLTLSRTYRDRLL